MFGFVRKSEYNNMLEARDEVIDSLHAQMDENTNLKQSIREMADEIREMDQMIYRMSQCTSWETMRPIFNDLQARQERRQHNESNRITGILQKELLDVYAPKPKQLPLATQGHPDNPTRHRPR